MHHKRCAISRDFESAKVLLGFCPSPFPLRLPPRPYSTLNFILRCNQELVTEATTFKRHETIRLTSTSYHTRSLLLRAGFSGFRLFESLISKYTFPVVTGRNSTHYIRQEYAVRALGRQTQASPILLALNTRNTCERSLPSGPEKEKKQRRSKQCYLLNSN